MIRILFIALILFGVTACDNSIKNGDLVYLSLRKDRNLSLNSENDFQCSNSNKTPLVYIEKEDGSFILKTEKGLNVLFKNYFLKARQEEPTIFRLENLEEGKFIVSPSNRYLGCNGKQVYQSDEPYVSIMKF